MTKKMTSIFEFTFLLNFFLKSSLFYFLAPWLQRPRSPAPARVSVVSYVGLHPLMFHICTRGHVLHDVRVVHSEWISNHHRDTFASHIGHYDLLSYMAVAENEAVARTRYKLLEVGYCIVCRDHCVIMGPVPTLTTRFEPSCRAQKMFHPCGNPPEKEDAEDDDDDDEN